MDVLRLAKRRDILLERARLDAAASVAGGRNARGAVLDLLAVAAQRGIAAVKERILLGVLRRASPVPVLLIVSKGLQRHETEVEILTGWVPVNPHSVCRARSNAQV